MTDIAAAFASVVEYLEAHELEESCYGFGHPDNPHDFSPDGESCSAQELEAHRLACEAYDRGDYRPSDRHGCTFQPGVIACYAPWGIGVYTIRDPRVAEALEVLREVMTSAGFRAEEEP